MLGYLRAEPQITEAFRTGEGVGWHEHDDDVFVGCDAFYRPGYVAELVPNWIPALDGRRGEADGRAPGSPTSAAASGRRRCCSAEAYPRSTVVGSDYHAESIELARKKAAEAGVADRVTFEVATAQTFTGTGYDLVTTFDCLHDMGDPLGAARRVREALAPDGTWLLVEPNAADAVEDNLNPVGRLYYDGSLFLCVPNALSQPGGYALGAQAGRGGDPGGRRRGGLHPVPAGRADPVQPGVRDPAVSTGMIPAGRGVTLCGRPRGRRGGERFRLWMSIKGKRAEEDDDDLVNHAS